MLNLINDWPYIDKIYLYAKDPYEAKYKLSIERREKIDLQSCDDPNAFIEYLNDMHAWCLWKYWRVLSRKGKQKVLIVFDDMIANKISNKKLYSMVT